MNMNLKIVYLLVLIFTAIGCQNISDTVIKVGTVAELQKAIKTAKPGYEIVLQNGKWENVQIELQCNGTKDAPITIKAETAGEVFIEGESYIKIGGDYLIVDGLFFKNGYTPINALIQFRTDDENVANNCKVINCVIKDFNQLHRDRPDHWIEFWGKYNTLEKCYIAGKSNQGPTIRVDIKGNQNINNYHQIINNHFGPRPRKGGPRGETIQIGDSYTSMSPSYTKVANNYFEKCNGEVEVISSKTNFNEFRNNIFYKCEGSLVMRHGNYCIIDGNYFIGDENSNNIGGIRIINTGHWVTNNYFYNLKGENFRSPIAVMNGIPRSPLNRYNQVTDVVIAFNSWINCKSPLQFGVGTNISQKDVLPESEIRSAIPIRTIVANNVIYNEKSDNEIVVAHDKLDGIKFLNNYVGNGIADGPKIPGFEFKTIKMKEESENFFVPESGLDNSELYSGFESIDKDILGNSRADGNVAGAVCNTNKNTANIFDVKNYGPNWYPKIEENRTPNKINVSIENVDFNSIINQARNGDILLLSEGTYKISNPIIINKKIIIKPADENGKVIIKYSGEKETPLFEMNPYGDISIEKISLIGENTQYAFVSLKENMSSLYNIKVSDCEISDFNFVLRAYKESFSDEIFFSRTKVRNCENGIELSAEIDDKGDYNVEFLTIENCDFDNVKSNVIDYYRGGYDESTIGGNLTVSHSSFTNCGSKEENGILLNTRGIINVNIANNIFKNNKVKLVALLWGAKNNNHSENEIINSGKIVVEENLKLKLMY